MRGCLDEMLPLVGLGLGAKPRFGWLGPVAVSGCAAGVGHVGTGASVFIFCVGKAFPFLWQESRFNSSWLARQVGIKINGKKILSRLVFLLLFHPFPYLCYPISIFAKTGEGISRPFCAASCFHLE
jgi:hypothetical protein